MKIDKSGRKLSDESLSTMGGETRFKPTHGMRKSPEYYTWSSMKARCLNPKVESYKNYGGRGITICERWRDSFESFLADLGPRPDGHSIERIDHDGNYEPGNVVWLPIKKQQRNKRTTVMVIYQGKKVPVMEYALATNQKPDSVRSKIRNGRPLDGAIPC